MLPSGFQFKSQDHTCANLPGSFVMQMQKKSEKDEYNQPLIYYVLGSEG